MQAIHLGLDEGRSEMSQLACDRLLIFTCDEFGELASANRAVIDAIERGAVAGIPVGATIQMPAPAASEAAAYAAAHPSADIGVHLTIESGRGAMKFRPVCAPKRVPGLCAPDGSMWQNAAFAWEHASEEEVCRECRAQVEAALSLGVDVTHLDGHGGFQGGNPAGYVRVCGRLAEEFDLPLRVRARDWYADAGAADEWDGVRARGVLTSDGCRDLGIREAGGSCADLYRRLLRDLPPGLTDVYAHPCVDSDELQALQPERAAMRVEQYDLLLNVRHLNEALAETGVRMTTWREIRDRQRAARRQGS